MKNVVLYIRNQKMGGNMRHKIKKIVISYILSICCILSFTIGSFKSHNVYASYSRYITARSLTVRKKASIKGKVAGYYKKGTKVTCYSKSGNWTKVKYGSHKYYVSTKYLSTKKPSTATKSSTYIRYVTASSLTVRKKATTSSAKLGSYKKGTSITCYGNKSGWTTIKYSGKNAYVSSSYLSPTKPSKINSTVSKGRQVANYAKQFIGNPYKWGGESLTRGADCSGFTMKVYQHFGYHLPHSSISQRRYGKSVSWSSKQVGDLICYNAINGVGHVGIYIGNNQVVHAGSTATGIHTSTANYRSVNCVRRIVK